MSEREYPSGGGCLAAASRAVPSARERTSEREREKREVGGGVEQSRREREIQWGQGQVGFFGRIWD